jgi:histidine ammonia-lyase
MYVLGTGGIDAKTAIEVARGAKLEIHPVVRERVAEAAGRFESLLATGQPVYGVTTEVAARSAVPIAPEDRPAYQLATLRSHACGLGPPLDRTAARAAWVAKLACLATGRPGASVGLLDSLKTALNAGLAPSIPSTGSLAASGDLIPSAHAALPLIGEGELLDGASSGLAPLKLGPRDGLSLVNGTAVTTGLAICAVAGARALLECADALAAAGVEATGGHTAAFREDIAGAKPHPGARASAAAIRSGLPAEGVVPRRTAPHDPYAWRCAPQVHGAVRDAVTILSDVCDAELRGCSDNPLLVDDGIASGGNFHAAALGLPLDAATTAVGVLAALSRQRTVQLLSGRYAPEGLACEGLGLALLATSATARLLEIQQLIPASSRWLPVDASEDHVANATLAAHQLRLAIAGAYDVLACEALCVAAAADLTGTVPAGPALTFLYDLVRTHLNPPGPDVATDRALAAVSAGLTTWQETSCSL